MADVELTQLGRYRIIAELGRGAMGVVYRAEDPMLDRTVAIKTILLAADSTDRAEYEARFYQEAKAAGRLSHPGIITIHDIGREGDMAYMAMEMLEGTDLRTRMSQGRIPVPHAIDIAEQVAEGLAFAHERGVIHRDVKPGNIMILGGDRVKILDFGIARMRVSDLKTQTGVLLGTPKYMSPEQVAGHPVDQRSDIFSLGIVLYEMLTGTTPFSGSDTTQLMYNVASSSHVPPSRINSKVPAILDLIVAKALEKDADARYQDADELARDLRGSLAELDEHPVHPGDNANKTIRLDTSPSSASPPEKDAAKTISLDTENTKTGRIAATPNTVDSSTRLPLSRRFDSSKALQRVAAPTAPDRALLSRSPQPLSALSRLWRDPGQRLLFCAVAAAALVGIVIAFA